MFDGRARKTILKELVYKELGINKPGELVSWIYSSHTPKNRIADLAPLLNEALKSNDEAAKKIAENAAKGLSELAVTAWKTSGMTTGDIVFMGSIFKHFPYIRKCTEERILKELPDVHIKEPDNDAAYGAAKLAMKEFSAQPGTEAPNA